MGVAVCFPDARAAPTVVQDVSELPDEDEAGELSTGGERK